MKLSEQLTKHVHAINCGAVRKDDKGRFYYIVPTGVRRSGQMFIQPATIVKLKKMNLIPKYFGA